MKNRRFKFILFSLLSLIVAYHVFQTRVSVEERLLESFQAELKMVNSYQTDYVGYMTRQIDDFQKKQNETSRLIQQINEKYLGLSDSERIAYQKKWQKIFQPVIDEIYNQTRNMILVQKAKADAGQLVKIQELTVRMELLEKETAVTKILPQFFEEQGN